MIHEKACVSEDSEVHYCAKVWQFANVCRGSVIGSGTSIAPYTNIDGALIGHSTAISMWTSIPPGWEIKDRCFIGPAVILINDMWPETSKEGFDVDELITPKTNKRIGVIESDAVIGAQCTLMAGIRIGEGAMVAAGSIVNQSVPAGMLWTRGGDIVPRPAYTKDQRLRFVND